MDRYDLIVIGSGPAGRRAAIQAAKLGKSVLVIENRLRLGGVSVHTGTIPSKTLRETVLNLSGWRERGFYGLAYRVKKDIEGKDLGVRLRMTLDHEIEVLEHQFARNGVKTFGGVARFVDPHCLTVKNHLEEHGFEGEKIVIAVGTAPFHPPGIPFNDRNVFDSDGIATDPHVPKSLTVVGAGVIGIEYATIFSALDVPVTVIEPRAGFSRIHRPRDHRGVRARPEGARHPVPSRRPCGARRTGRRGLCGEPPLGRAHGAQRDAALCRRPPGRDQGSGAGELRADADARGRLKVDPVTFQTSVPHIYAAGDVIGFPSLASTSMEQGRIAACHAFDAPTPTAPEHFPYGIYAVPEISTVGLTEAQVREKGIAYEVGIARLREVSRGHIMGLESGMMKLLFALDDRRLLGAHIVGEGATELIHIGQAVLNLGGGIDYFVENAFNYPTLAEGYKVAALDAYNRMGPR